VAVTLKKWGSEDVGGCTPGSEGDSSSLELENDQTTDYGEWSDLDLVQSVIDLRGNAYAELYRRHSKSVAATAKMILVNDSRCEDVVAEVFVALWFAPEKFDPLRGTLLSFLRVKARGRAIDIVRQETARRRREEVGSQFNEGFTKPADSHTLEIEFAVAIRAGVGLLPKSEREAIELAFCAGLTYQAVAVQLGLPEGTVKSRIRNGLKRLQSNDGIRLQHGAAERSFVPEDALEESAVGNAS
jgi:RNA polymerase sigma factor (sigma-70 family)